jgi:hypothetical protein
MPLLPNELIADILVSKQLCSVAQPMLWSVLHLKGEKVSVLSRFPRLAKHTRIVELGKAHELTDVALEAIATLPDLTEARIEGATNLTNHHLRNLQCASYAFRILPVLG